MALNKDAVLKSAEKLVQKGKIEAAIKEYKKVLKKTGEDPNTLNRIGDLFARLRRNDEAIHHYSQTAGAYAQDGFYVKAIAVHKKSLRLEPGRLDIHQKLAELYHRQGLIPDARTHYQHVADHHQRQSDPTSAITVYQKMIELEPDNPSPRVKLADLYKQQKLFGKAIGEYGAIASLMLEHQQVEQASQVYQRALDLDASNLEFVRESLGRLQQAAAPAAAQTLLAAAIQKNPAAEGLRGFLAGGGGAAPQPTPTPAPQPPPAAPQPQAAPSTALPAVEPPPPAPPAAPTPVTGTGPQAPVVPPAAAPELTGTGAQAPVAPAAAPELAGTGAQAPVAPSVPPQPVASPGEGASPGAPSAETMAPPPVEAQPEASTAAFLPQPAAPAAPAPPEAPTPPADSAPPAARAEEDFEEFVLDLDEDMPPPTLVEPPSDMPPGAGTGFQQAITGAQSIELEIEPPETVAGGEFSFQPEPELGQPTLSPEDVDLELTESQLQPSPLDSPPQPTPVEPPAAPTVEPAPTPGPVGPGFEAPVGAPPREAPPAPPTDAARRPLDDLLAEAEVFVKYGLAEKAIDRLREVLTHSPEHLGAYSQLIPLLLEQGLNEEVGGLAASMAAIAHRAGKPEAWTELQQVLVDAGYGFSGDTVVALPGGAAPATAGGAPATPDRTMEAAAAAESPSVEMPVVGPAPLEATVPTVEPAPAPPELSTEVELDEITSEVIPESVPHELEQSSGMETVVLRPGSIPIPEPGQTPLPPPIPAAAPPATTGVGSTDWLNEPEAAPPAASGEHLFDDEEQFFDLEAELQEDLQEEQAAGAEEPREQTLEEIVEGFKKGVAENLSPEDSDTHYNLGIAYREMMLVDEAIGEFQIAAKDPRYLVDCCAMLGQCFTDKGLPELALKWYQKALESPDMEEDRTLGLLYDVGHLHLSMNDRDAAYQAFLAIYGINTNYRDVVAKMQQLQPSGAH